MSAFGELFARYPEKVWDMLEQECYDEGRLYCGADIGEPTQYLCRLCDRHAFSDGTGNWKDPLNVVCDNEQCRELWAWYEASKTEGGYKRRACLRQHFGKTIYEIPRPMRREALLTAVLLVEAQEKANAGKKRQRVAA